MSRFFIFIIQTINSANAYYPLALTSMQISAAKALDESLNQPSIQLQEPIHSLAYSLMSSSCSEVAENQLQCPQLVFLVFINVRSNSGLNTAEAISKCLSKFLWGIRATAVYESLMHRNEYQDGMIGYVSLFLSENQ
jgi:hypothetical protein